ncbi:hypothetical protein EWM64_g5312 [Hericium alpestre]|uniref:BTB domain-containing protein n=1 Tax=Hericium alpestre TaxID=135208 RepID=A0A4Y9ZV69_9AGAM|nr:hypothetical protein EWM64_g5312 [Hericium alpestre]
MSAIPEVREFGAPFDDHDADIILRSSDAVDFHIYKAILKKGARGFADMFAAQLIPPTEPGSQEYRDGLPIIAVSETSHTLNLFLQFLYPIANPQISDTEDIALVLDAFRKYVVEGYAKPMESMLLAFLDGDSYFDPKNTGSVCIILPFTDDDISLLTTRQYHALVQFQSTCKAIARHQARRGNWKENFDVLPGRNPFDSALPEDDPECECEWIAEDDCTPAWFAFYSYKFGEYLGEHPHPSQVLAYNPSIPQDQRESALKCPTCRFSIQDNLAQFKQRLHKKILQRYDKVRVYLLFMQRSLTRA